MLNDRNILISVLIPVYNVSKYIKRCVVSLFEQSYNDSIEYIFVDDCSPDDSVEILRGLLNDYPQRAGCVKILTHEINKGLSEARNTALLNAVGKYVMHVDSDDYVEVDMIEILLRNALSHDADMVVCDFNNEYEKYVVKTNVMFDDDIIKYLSLLLTRKSPANIWGRIIKREILINNNIFAIPNLNHGEDYAVVPRVVFHSKVIVKINEALYNYVRYNASSYTHCVNEKAINDTIWANQILNEYFVGMGMRKVLPLDESLAVNAVTLFYCSNKQCFGKIASTCLGLDLWRLNLKTLHRIILFLARFRMYDMLYVLIKIINILRSAMK